MSKTRLVGVVAVLIALSGCAGAKPGVAVQAGDETIPMNQVDEYAGDYCEYLTDRLSSADQALEQRFFRGGIAAILAVNLVGDQLAAEYGVQAGEDYDRELSNSQQSAQQFDEEIRDAIVAVETADVYVASLQEAIGAAALREEGVTNAAYDEKVERGRQAFEDWIAEHGVEFDPSLGVELKDLQAAPVDTSLSVPAGDAALAGVAESPDAAYVKGLPDNQRCG